MSSSLLLKQCPIYLVLLTWIVFVMGGRWPYSCCFGKCCLHDLFNIANSIFVQLPSSFFTIRLVSVHAVHPYSSINTTAANKNCFSFHRSGLTSRCPIYSLSIAVHAFARHVLMSVLVDETLLPR